MKRVLLLVGLLLAPWIAEANSFNISVARKKADARLAKPTAEGGVSEKSETFFYEVSVANKAFKPSEPVTAKYIVFVERQEVGEKPGSEQIEKIKGEGEIAAMKAQGKESLNTKEVTLREKAIVGNYIFVSGGRLKSRDTLVGVWVKLFQGDTEVGEFVNPTTLANKHKWSLE
jgi:hypothetical protein